MSVYKRTFKNGDKWCVYLILPDGSKFRKAIGTKKEAEKVEQQLKSQLIAGKWNLQENIDTLFSVLVNDYLEYAKTNKAESTYRNDKCRIEAHLLPYFGDMILVQVTPQILESYKRERLEQGASPNTVNHELANLSHMFRMAIRWGLIDRNPVSYVDKMKIPEKPKRFLSQVQIERLMEAADSSHIFPLIVTALHTGMRKSELFNLKWSDIDFDRMTITVQSKDDWHTKNYRSRTLQITPVLYDVLIEHRKQHLLNVQSEYAFTYNGKKLRSNIKRSLARVMNKAGLNGVTLHTFRHTFASQLAMAGVSIKEVQELMGHRSFETTLQYAHLSEDHVKQQVMKLPFASHSGNSRTRIGHAKPFLVDNPRKERTT